MGHVDEVPGAVTHLGERDPALPTLARTFPRERIGREGGSCQAGESTIRLLTFVVKWLPKVGSINCVAEPRYFTDKISSALQWRLQYGRVIVQAGLVDGI